MPSPTLPPNDSPILAQPDPVNRRIAVLQLDAVAGARRQNAESAAAMVIEARADLVVLPELFATEFFPWDKADAYFQYAQGTDGEVVTILADAARAAKSTVVVPFFEKAEGGACYNSAAVIGPDGKIIGVYRKTHIPFSRSYEKYYFMPGHELPVFDTPVGRIGLLICYDRWYPEAWRKLVDQGAQIICCPISSGGINGQSELPIWEALLRVRARENEVFVAAANRTGIEGPYDNIGHSMIVAPTGTVLADAGHHGRKALVVDCDLNEVERQRRATPFLRDRRPELY